MILYKFIKYLIMNIKYTRIIKNVYENEGLIPKFSQMFDTEFRVDWVGRVYAVLNPNIVDNKMDYNTQIFEYGENGLTNEPYVEKWIMTKFNLIRDFVMANNLFDILTYELKKLDDYDNYLFIIKPITFDDCQKWTKWFAIELGVLLIIGIFLLILL